MAGSTKSSSMPPFLKLSQTEAMVALQKELIETYEQANRIWLDRVKSEVEFWSELGKKLSTTHSVPEVLQAYQESAAQRMRMAAEDGQKVSEDCRLFTQKIARSLSNGWVGESS